MTKVKFIHTSDLHLDTPFKSLSNWNPELAARLKDATFKSFRKIVDLCISERVDFLIIAGDTFDSENKSLAAQLRFVKELKRLSDKGIPTYLVCGNHDPLSSWLENLELPENVYRYGSVEVESNTFQKNGKPVADVHGISFQNKTVTKNLVKKYKLRSDPAPISIAIMHGTVGSSGQHENYAPFKVDDIAGKGFDYWALGHIHKTQIVRDVNPTIVYPGNPQGRDFGETGAKGCYLVEITENSKPKTKFIPTQLIRFEEVDVDITGEDKIDALPQRLEKAIGEIADYDENSSYILRVRFTGRTSLHKQLTEPGETGHLLELFNEEQLNLSAFTWIDSIEISTKPNLDIDQIKKGAAFPAEILKAIDSYEFDQDKFIDLIKSLEEELVNAQAKREIAGLSTKEQDQILEKIKWILLDQLMQEQK